MRSLKPDTCFRELGTQASPVLQNFKINHLLQVPLCSVLMIAACLLSFVVRPLNPDCVCAEEPSHSTLSLGSQQALCLAAVDGKVFIIYQLVDTTQPSTKYL